MKTLSLRFVASTSLALACITVGCSGDGDAVATESTAEAGQHITDGTPFSTESNRITLVAALYHGGPRPCSATVISASVGWVITAAHCVTVDESINGAVKPYSSLAVSLDASPGLTRPANAMPVTNVILNGSYDLALLRIAPFSATPGSNHGLWLASPTVLMDKALWAFGYGRSVRTGDDSTEDGSTGAGTLRYTAVRVVEAGFNAFRFTPIYGNQTTDHGDSGGPTFEWHSYGSWEAGDYEEGRFLAGVHWMGSAGTGYDTAVAVGTNWLMDNVGWMYIFRIHGWGSSEVKYMDVQWGGSAAQTPIWTWDYNGSRAQHWKYNADTMTIRNESGLCLDVKNNGSANGTPVWLWPCDGNSAQQWEFTDSLAIRNANGKCLDVPGGSTERGQLLQIWDCNGSSAQRWAISPSPY